MTRASLTAGNVARLARRGLVVLLATSALSLSSPARAQELAETSQAAEVLFAQGRTWMKERRYDEACAAFEKSERLDPASGTLLNLGVCLEAQGRTASAFRDYQVGLVLSQVEQNSDGERIARERIAALEPRLSRIVLSVGSPRAGLVVHLDGVVVDPKSWGEAMPIDPGTHRLESRASDQDHWSTVFTIEAAGSVQTLQVESPRTKPATTPSWQMERGASRKAAGKELQVHLPRARRAARPLRWPFVVSSGVATAGVLSTVYFGLLASGAWQERNEHCPDHQCDRFAGLAFDRARRYARAADVAAVFAAVGGVAAASFLIFDTGPTTSASSHLTWRVESRGTNLDLACEF